MGKSIVGGIAAVDAMGLDLNRPWRSGKAEKEPGVLTGLFYSRSFVGRDPFSPTSSELPPELCSRLSRLLP